MAGPDDWQDGLTYWVRRAARGGPVALPGDPGQPVQVIGSRDLARLVVRLLADDRPGAFHAVGPAEPVTIAGGDRDLRAGINGNAGPKRGRPTRGRGPGGEGRTGPER